MLNFNHLDLPLQNNGTTNVKVSYLGEVKGVTVESPINVQSVGSLQDALRRTQRGFRISKLLGYFKLKADRRLISRKDGDVEIEIKYSLVAWDLAMEKDDPHPKVAYLERVNKTWAEEWILFDPNDKDVDIEVVPYVPGSPYRTLKIRHRRLPDPLIGGT